MAKIKQNIIQQTKNQNNYLYPDTYHDKIPVHQLPSELNLQHKKDHLDTYASSVSIVDTQTVTVQKYNSDINSLRNIAGEIVGGRIADCGKKIVASKNTVDIVNYSKSYYYSGLEHCGSVWVCPVCNYKISKYRAEQIHNTVSNIRAGCGSVGMMVLTAPHHRWTNLQDSLDVVINSWRKVKSGRKFIELKQKYNYIGDIRVLQTTWGKNGWHNHLHILLSAYCDEIELEAFAGKLFELWQDKVQKADFKRPNKQGYKFTVVYDEHGISNYICTGGIADEMTNVRRAKDGNRTPFEILQDIKDNKGNTEQDIRLFREYATFFKGKKQLTWSKGMKNDYCDLKDKKDEQIVKDETRGNIVLSLSKNVFKSIVKADIRVDVLNEFALNGIKGVLKLLKAHGIKFKYKPKQKLIL